MAADAPGRGCRSVRRETGTKARAFAEFNTKPTPWKKLPRVIGKAGGMP